MERYIGIDVHRDSSTVAVVSAQGKRAKRDVLETNGRALVGLEGAIVVVDCLF